MHRKTNFLVNLYGDNKYTDSDSEHALKHYCCMRKEAISVSLRNPFEAPIRRQRSKAPPTMSRRQTRCVNCGFLVMRCVALRADWGGECPGISAPLFCVWAKRREKNSIVWVLLLQREWGTVSYTHLTLPTRSTV